MPIIHEWDVRPEDRDDVGYVSGMTFFRSPADEAEVRREIAEGAAELEPPVVESPIAEVAEGQANVRIFPNNLGVVVIGDMMREADLPRERQD